MGRGRDRRFNGATTMESWKGSAKRPASFSSVLLQWGHDDGVVERPRRGPAARPTSTSFNGATTMESWNGRRPLGRLASGGLASMGPRRWSRGKGPTGRNSWGREFTLQWGHDNGVVERDFLARGANQGGESFNGATTMESWKGHHLSSRSMRTSRFNGATTMVSWKGRQRIHRDLYSPGFNGATTMESWKGAGPAWRRPALAQGFNGATTMESWKGHRERTERGHWYRCFNGATTMESWKGAAPRSGRRRRSSRFNGATTMESWKGRASGNSTLAHNLLQWGHDDGVVERAYGNVSNLSPVLASMGPRRWSRGKG